ncbi:MULTISPECIES: patatin-like phospholipase family protein [unclassified Crossiella]|uniref:patatin-like phospholipase family protein n=1 Tax=unclassified Crossiella TaxID=2620835 RepID=UPI0020001778|nr:MULTISPECIES: patatin-like phospholipase family protein [unclassified Crossiella]MCK2239015.1 patatin-like phospholipase family protein [Crossiella sp. S99.2]MCK2251416.1 patatin-like phospholipase family protein [Crossiella sp. S99.1]
MPRRGLAIGCGGTLGFAWTAIALQSVQRQLDWDARTAEVLLGTSAGAEMVALLGSGRSADSIVAALDGSGEDAVLAGHLARHPGMRPPLPGWGWPARGLVSSGLRGEVDLTAGLAGLLPKGRGDAGWLRELGDQLAGGWVAHPATWIVAADAATGSRTAFGSPTAPETVLGQAIAASWAIPGWFPPVRIAGREHVDGGTISSVSADLLVPLELDEVVVLAPMTSEHPVPATGLSRLERLLRKRMTRGLDREVRQLRAAGTRVIRVEPGPAELAAMGANFMDLRRRQSTVDVSRLHTPTRVRAAISNGVAA